MFIIALRCEIKGIDSFPFPAYHGSGPGADAFPAGTGHSIPHPGAVLVLGISYDKVPGKAQQVPG